MTLAAGTKLGPYEILSSLGSGGMGEVYRARDTKLDRDVAVKILPERLAGDADALSRFEREAKAVAALSHPNILGIFDFGRDGANVYAAMELLEGENLRERLSGGALSPRKAIEYALQIAAGLAAAHEKGIVHRDLKPENVFVTHEGRIKLLDFGLAKVVTMADAGSVAPTAALATEPGVVMGTVGYMSPEQVRGKPADHRSDIFSFGAILYEMLSGKRAFHGDSAAETMAAIAKEEPPDLSTATPSVSPALDAVVRHCLEKNPGERFQSARDLAFALQSVSGLSSKSGAPLVLQSRRRRWIVPALAAALVVFAAFFLGSRIGARGARAHEPKFRRLTFRRGNVLFARFTPDGQNVVYSAAWDDKPTEIFITHIGQPESRPLGIPNADVLSVSRTGELAIKLKKHDLYGTAGSGTLARVPLEGGAPREILEDVERADWLPDGSSLMVVRAVNGKHVIELPIGKKIYESTTDIWDPRLSPRGDLVAFGEEVDGLGAVSVVDLAGRKRVLTKGWINVADIAWTPSGREIWFDSVGQGHGQVTSAVSVDGAFRVVSSGIDLVIHDIASDGRVLLEQEIPHDGMYFGRVGDPAERDISWFEGSSVGNISADGKLVAFTEGREGGGRISTAYLRGTDGSAPVKLGEGQVDDLSQDGKWVLLSAPSGPGRKFSRVPSGAGEPIPVSIPGMTVFGGGFAVDGRRLIFGGLVPGHGVRAYVAGLDGKSPFAFTPEGVNGPAASSPDGKRFVLVGPAGKPMICAFDGKEARELPATENGDRPIQWSADGRSVYLQRQGELPARIYRYDLDSHARTLWKEIMPSDRAGVIAISDIHMTPDATAYAYSCARITSSDLYLVEGWK
jgi:serine/threonine protein kinase